MKRVFCAAIESADNVDVYVFCIRTENVGVIKTALSHFFKQNYKTNYQIDAQFKLNFPMSDDISKDRLKSYGDVLFEKLKEYGLNTKAIESENDDINKVFEGMKIVLTGTLPTLKRNDAKEMIESRGGKSTSSVSKSTTFVLAGEEAGSKLTKANELGIKVIDEDTFIELCKLSSKEDVESRLI